jgi:hypothetical protein
MVIPAVKFEHGKDCKKAEHRDGGGYLHDANDDRPYEIDGLMYCGRCHYWMGSEILGVEGEK